jgi:hypothetical protein
MTPKGLFWCGEGDLFFDRRLRIRNLLILRYAKGGKTGTNALRGHNLGTRPKQQESNHGF